MLRVSLQIALAEHVVTILTVMLWKASVAHTLFAVELCRDAVHTPHAPGARVVADCSPDAQVRQLVKLAETRPSRNNLPFPLGHLQPYKVQAA